MHPDTSQRRRLATLALVATTALLSAAATTAMANHAYPDHPDGNPFHEEVGNFAAAGCASGFPDGTFRGRDEVKRQQMARFINSCGGRIDAAQAAVEIPGTGAETELLTLDMNAGAQPGGAGLVLVHADVHMSVDPEGPDELPCQTRVDLDDGTTEVATTWIDIPETTLAVSDANGSISAVVPLAAGESLSVALTTFHSCAGTPVWAEADAYALYVPFDGNGLGGADSPLAERARVDESGITRG